MSVVTTCDGFEVGLEMRVVMVLTIPLYMLKINRSSSHRRPTLPSESALYNADQAWDWVGVVGGGRVVSGSLICGVFFIERLVWW